MVGSRAAACLLLLSLLAWPATASTLGDVTGGVASYQFDGDTHHDAPDGCDLADPAWALPFLGRTDGTLAPPDDVADVFVLDIPADAVGSRMVLGLMEGVESVDLDLGAFAPGCDGDVFATRNQPVPFPQPPAPTDGERQVAVDATFLECGADWFFLVNGLLGTTPDAIHAAWTDGSEATIPLTLVENGEVGIYRTPGAQATLKGAWVNVPSAWNGTFKVAHQPCGVTDGGAVYGDPAMLGNDRISFTPIRSGAHLVLVTLAPPTAAPPGTSVPMTCHFCLDEVEQVVTKASYVLRADETSS